MKRIKIMFMLGVLFATLTIFSFQAYATTSSQPCENHVEEIDWGEEATCTSNGLTDGSHCSVCGEILVKQEIIPASGHILIDDSKLTAKKKAFTVKIKKYTTQTTGYQIQYSTDKKFKKAKSVNVSNKTTTKTIKNLKAKTTYYVRLRTYKTLKDGKYYSSFSKTKVIKTK